MSRTYHHGKRQYNKKSKRNWGKFRCTCDRCIPQKQTRKAEQDLQVMKKEWKDVKESYVTC